MVYRVVGVFRQLEAYEKNTSKSILLNFEPADPGSFLLEEKTKCTARTKIMMNDKIKDVTQDISSSCGNSEVYIPL